MLTLALVTLVAMAASDPVPPTRKGEDMYVYHVNDAQGRRDLVSLLSPEQTQQRGGLPLPAIIGSLKTRLDAGGDLTPENLIVNPEMVRYLHAFVARTGPTIPGAIAAARGAQTRGDRWLNLYDGRRNRHQEPLREDLIGTFEVVDGTIRPDTYRDNAGEHLILSKSGVFRLDAELHERYIEALVAEPVDARP